jgi:hypothetical protein
MAISQATFFGWKNVYSGLMPSEVRELMRVTRSATAPVVIEALEEARQRLGLPHTIRVDQGLSVHLEGA